MSADRRARIVVLGTGSSIPARGHTNTSFAILTPSETWLVDAGPALVDRLLALRLAPLDVTQVFLTHQHADHLLGMTMLNNARWDADPGATLTVHGPAVALEALRTVTSAAYPDHVNRLDRLVVCHVHAVDRRETEPVGAVIVRSVAANHSVPAVAYRFEFASGSVVFSGDTAPSDAIADLAGGADLLVHDATFSAGRGAGATAPDHSTAGEAGQIAARAGARRLALVHRPPEAAGREHELQRDAAAAFAGDVIVPDEGDMLLVGDSEVS